MEESEIVEIFSKHSLVLTTHGFNKIIEENLNFEEVIRRAKETDVWLVTHEFIEEFTLRKGEKEEDTKEKEEEIREEKKEEKEETVVVRRKTPSIVAKELDAHLKIYDESDVTGKSSCSGKIEDFLDYFNQKYENLQRILQERYNLKGTIPIQQVKKYSGDELVSIIVMIREKRESKRGYRFLEVEDRTGELTVLIPKDNDRLNQVYEHILLDEVVGIHGLLRNNLFIAQEIFEPELPVNHKPIPTEDPVNIALISDIHVGSYLFLETEFNRFIEWLNLQGEKKEIAERVKYIFVAGDLVDGIGVYPNQEQELSIPDIYKQYDFLASLLEKIPDYIEIILSVGNHDAVRNAEPQPTLDKEIAPRLYELPNIHLVGNPAWINTHGVKTLLYHGTSLDTIIGSLADCTYSRPENAMVEYLKKRYLVPMYGNDSLSPEGEDFLAIKEIPDIFHCGHVHTNGYANYRGVTVINSGTFQGRTKYQEELGHLPTPARVPIVNLQSFEVSVIHF
jgi:DNA polymerase II small subunit